MTWTIGLYSLGTALCAFSTGPLSLLMFRLLTGLGVGGEWAVGHALLQEASPSHMRGRAAAFLQAGEPLGVGLAAVMGLLVTPLIGWRWVFLVSSASAVLAFVARRHLPESSLWNRQKRKSSFRRSPLWSGWSAIISWRRCSRAGCWACSSWALTGPATSGCPSFCRTSSTSPSAVRRCGF